MCDSCSLFTSGTLQQYISEKDFLRSYREKEDDIWNIRVKIGELGTVDFKVDTEADVKEKTQSHATNRQYVIWPW